MMAGCAADFFLVPAPSSPTQGEPMQPITESSAAVIQPCGVKLIAYLFFYKCNFNYNYIIIIA